MPRNLSPEEADEVGRLLLRTEDPDVADRLTDWEKGFVQSVAEQYSNISWLSEKQINGLKKIVEGEANGQTDRTDNRRFSRPSKLSYGSSEAAGRNPGFFSGFGGEGEED